MAKKGIKLFTDEVVTRIRTNHLNEYYKVLNAGDFLVSKVKEIILSGQSPVSGFGRYQKYSKSYIEYIEGKAYYFTNKYGRVVRIANKPFKGKGSVKRNKSIQNLSKPFANKNRSPVNLYATGDMMDSLRIKKDSTNKVILLGFTDKKAKYHDKLGASKKKVIRRLLPTRQGEKFKSNINTALKQYCKDSLYKVLMNERISIMFRFNQY